MKAFAKGATYVVMIQTVGVGCAVEEVATVEDATAVEDAATVEVAAIIEDNATVEEAAMVELAMLFFGRPANPER